MTDLKIVIREWKQGALPSGDTGCFAADALEALERKVRIRAADREPGGIATDAASLVTSFCDDYAPDLQEVLRLGREDLVAAWTNTDAAIAVPDWPAVLQHGPAAEAAAISFVVRLMGVILNTPERVEVDETPGKGHGVDAGGKRGPAAVSQPATPAIVPAEYLGEGVVPSGVGPALRSDLEVHLLWRRALSTTRDLLRVFGIWLGDRQQAGPVRFSAVGRAQTEITAREEEMKFSREVIYPELIVDVPVDPPLQFLAAPPSYDYCDLRLTLAPFIAGPMAGHTLPSEWDMDVRDDGTTIEVRRWSHARREDLDRLQNLFKRMHELVHRPADASRSTVTEAGLRALLDELNCLGIEGLPPCWRAFADLVVGLRRMVVHHDGIEQKKQIQLALALGLAGADPLPDELAVQLTRHGTAVTWRDEGVLFLGLVLDSEADVREQFHVFVEFGREVMLYLVAEGALSPVAREHWLPRLAALPQRLEADFGRLQRHWRRRRQAAALDSLVERDDVESAASLLARIADEDDRSYLRAHFVTRLFAADPRAALAELAAVPPGEQRHETILAVLEAAIDVAAADLAEEVFDMWLSVDARHQVYRPDCLPLLELAASGLGLRRVAEYFDDGLHPAVRCDWLIFVYRRLPSVRRSMEWASRLDRLLNDTRALEGLDLERLAALYGVIRRTGQAGRQSVLGVVTGRIAGAPFQDYWEQKFDIKLGASSAPAER